MSKRYFEVVNSGSTGVGKINIYGVISSWNANANAIEFLANFYSELSENKRVNVHLNSHGGSVMEGLPIANTIKANGDATHTYCDGVTFSMAAIILLAAKKGHAHMARGSILMIHAASTPAAGNSKALKKSAEDLEKFDEVLATFLMARTGKTMEEVKAEYLDGEDHFFTAEEALAEGLIDHIEDYDAVPIPDNIRDMSYSEVSAWFDNNLENENNMFNKYGKLSALAKVAVADITATMLEEVNAQVQDSGVNGVTVVATSKLEEYDSKLEGLEADKTALNTKVTDLESKVTAKDARITELEKEVQDLGAKPAGTPGTPASDGDTIPSGNGTGDVINEFETTVDREYRELYG